MNKQRGEGEVAVVSGIALGGMILIGAIILGLWGCPKYAVYEQELAGKAELARAESNRQIAVREAQAKKDAASLLAEAEIERAKGVAEANRIIGDSLKGNESYLRYLWISGLKDGRDEGCPGFQVPPRGLQH